jgi:hypothetical protein
VPTINTQTINAGTSNTLSLQTNNVTAVTIDTSQKATFAGSVNITGGSGSINAINTFGFKNRIINGGMVIDQRNAGASVTANNSYTLDRWVIYNSQTGKLTFQQNAGSVTPPVGFNNYLGITSTSAYSIIAGDYFVLRQSIEGYNVADLGFGTTNAKTFTLSFQVYSSLTGTFGGVVKNGTENRCYPFTYSIPVANTWTTISITVSGDTTGTWTKTNTSGFMLDIGLGVGSTYSGTAGSWSGSSYISATGATSVVGTSGATFYITGVQLEVGSQATSFDYRPYGTEFMLCQRYFQITSSGVGYAANSTIYAQIALSLNTTMRAIPSINAPYVLTLTDGLANYTQSTANIAQNYFSTGYAGFILVGNFTGLTGFRPYILNTYAGVGGNITLSAEL